MKNCHTCQAIAQRNSGSAPLWDNITRTQYWDLGHRANTALPGWLVLVTRRHLVANDELSDEEAMELGLLLKRISAALKEVTDCLKTYVIQFNESPDHPHIHFQIVPRMADLPEGRRGRNVFSYLDVSDDERVSEEKMNEIALQIRQVLNRFEA